MIRQVPGWIHGVVEGAEPAVTGGSTGVLGVLAEAENFVITPAGKLSVRGGSASRRSFLEPGAAALSKMLTIVPFSPVGALVVGHYATGSKTYAYRCTAEMAFFTGAEATSRHDLGWNTAAPGRPIGTELFEKVYLADSTAFASRQGLTSVNSTGTVLTQVYDLDGSGAGTAALKAYTLAAFNGHLFVSGYDSETGGEAAAMVRHSFLGRSPDASNGFDPNAYNTLGATGVPVTAMAPGKSMLLVSKPSEIYRITGSGRALPGWQFVTQQMDNTRGMGASNPYAFTHAEGYWYGVGDAGPFVTDGTTIESLVGTRRISWAKVTNLSKAWVVYHPHRRCILFGFHQTPVDSGRSSTYPYVIWVWDIDRECWAGNWKFSADLMHASTVVSPTGGFTAPTAAPSGLSVDDTGATLTQVEINWTNGDATAETEVWYEYDGGGYHLYDVAAPAATTMNLTGLPSSVEFSIKIRHRKGSVYSDYTSVVLGHTLLEAPGTPAQAFAGKDLLVIIVSVPRAGVTLQIEREMVLVETTVGAPAGDHVYANSSLTCNTTYHYRARITHPSWPALINTSSYSGTLTAVTAPC